jgi:hypothetical protein
MNLGDTLKKLFPRKALVYKAIGFEEYDKIRCILKANKIKFDIKIDLDMNETNTTHKNKTFYKIYVLVEDEAKALKAINLR